MRASLPHEFCVCVKTNLCDFYIDVELLVMNIFGGIYLL
jgi:hypothetical protein